MNIQHSLRSLLALRIARLAVASLVAFAAGCNKGADVIVNLLDPLTMPGQVTYAATAGTLSVSGTVTGLVPGSSLTLTNKGTDALTLTGNGAFSFPRLLVDGASYEVTVSSQPATLRCIVQNGSGTLNGAGVTNVVVTCPMAYKASRVWMRCTHGQQWNVDAGDCTGTGGTGNNYGATGVKYCSLPDVGTTTYYCNDTAGGGPDGGSVKGQLTDPAHFTGGATSSLYNACQSLNTANNGAGTYGKTTWRVPYKDELKGLVKCSDSITASRTPLNDDMGDAASNPYKCGWGGSTSNYSDYSSNYSAPAIDTALFPTMPAAPVYWTSASTVWSNEAWGIGFAYGIAAGGLLKDTLSTVYVRCVSP